MSAYDTINIMHTIKIILSFTATISFLVAFFFYFKNIFLKRTQPHVYTWIVWAVTQGVAVAGLWYGNGGWGAIGLTVSEFFVICVLLLSFKYGTKNIAASDTVALVMCLIAIFFWLHLHNAILAVLMVSVIDAFAYFPTFRKSWNEPWSETLLSYGVFAVGDVCAILALTEYNILTVTYLASIATFNIILITLCLFRRQKIRNPAPISKS